MDKGKSNKKKIKKAIHKIKKSEAERITEETDAIVEEVEKKGSAAEVAAMNAGIQDRMMRYSMNPPCPKCNANSTACRLRRGTYALFYCRECEHRWEEGQV